MPASTRLLAVVLVLASGCLGFGTPDRSGWAYASTGLEALHDDGLDGSGVQVAVIDTGIDPSHPSLKDVRIVAWKDVTDGKPEPYDLDGHGTYVAGLVAGQGAMRGGAPGVDLIVVKVFDEETQATDSWVAQGIRFAVEKGADVIGLSLGGGSFPILGTATEDAARAATSRGVLVVAAAGNEGPDNADVRSPANVATVIAVAAAGRSREVADFSNRGSASSGVVLGLGTPRSAPDQKPEITAPGVGIVGPARGGGYVAGSGTSSAVPFVVSALALMLQAHPASRPQDDDGVREVKQWLAGSAADVPGAQTPHDRAAGYGYLDAQALVQRAG